MRVLIGCPTYEKYRYCLDLWVKTVNEIIDFSSKNGIEADYLLVDNSKTDEFYLAMKEKGINISKGPHHENVRKRLVDSRNILREKAIKEKYDYFFSLEQDVIPKNDVLVRLIKDNKKIISAYYGKDVGVRAMDKETGEVEEFVLEFPLVYFENKGGLRRANPPEVMNKGIMTVGAYGVGCLLMCREVLEKISFRFVEEKEAFDDFIFCEDAKKLGYELFLDSNIRVEHLHKDMDQILRN